MPEAAEDRSNAQSSAMRSLAREIFLAALSETSIEQAFERHVHSERGVLRVREDLYDLTSASRVLVVAVGKAANRMTAALAEGMGSGLGGIAVDVAEPEHHLPGFRYYAGGHPLPSAESVLAARAVLRATANLDARALVIFLISGGASALMEKPVASSIHLPDVVATYRALVLSGAPIAEINAIRKHLSAVKGGRLARQAAPAQQVSIMVSDVPDSALDALASGPTMPDSTTVEQCHSIVERYQLLPQFPPPVRALFEQRALEETPKPGDPAFARSRWWPVLTNADAQKAAAARAALAGFAVEVDNTCDDWDYVRAADYLLRRVRELRRGVTRACLISGGEVTVKVTDGGTGGRNQQFALCCATGIAGENLSVLSAGTDGIDGNSPNAGAVVDGTTLKRAWALGLDPEAALARFDAAPVCERLRDAIVTGPTGNNVRDLRILLAW